MTKKVLVMVTALKKELQSKYNLLEVHLTEEQAKVAKVFKIILQMQMVDKSIHSVHKCFDISSSDELDR